MRTERGTTAKNAPRQPMDCPRKLPSGAAMVVASALPPFNRASARGTSPSGTSRITVAADKDQKPPMTIPTSARPTMSTMKSDARAVTRPETIISPVRPSSSLRRSTDRVTDATKALVSTAKSPDTAIDWPARPSLKWRSDAMGVSRLTGMNSDAMSVATQRVSANTAPQDAERGAGAARGPVC
ncbi:hypothetical protein LXT21_35955 [Myxococcus sp. K38C18041901]|nr:hypothetical protein [Myxococcus guangdongensis]